MSAADAPRSQTSRMEIVPLTPEIWPALADLFAAGGDPKWCWCQFWRKPGSNWSNTSAAHNRADLERMAGDDLAPGLVALRDGVAVISNSPTDVLAHGFRPMALPPSRRAPTDVVITVGTDGSSARPESSRLSAC